MIKNLILIKIIGYLFFFILLSGCRNPDSGNIGHIEKLDSAFSSIIDENAKIEIVAEGFAWCEGPLWLDESKTLIFSDVPKNIIHSWSEEAGLKKYLTPSGYTGSKPRAGEMGSNGLALSLDNKLLICQHGDRKVSMMDASLINPNPHFITLAGNMGGKKLNSPNDLAVRSNGDIYFTDPPYGLPGLNNDTAKEIHFNGVYRISKGKVSLLIDTLTYPNGIAFMPNGNTFIVSNSDAERPIWYAFDIDEKDLIVNARIFYDATKEFKEERGGPDGLKVDKEGNVFATGPGGIWIFNSKGKVLGKIKLKGAVSNCAFGDGGKLLFVTNGNRVVSIALKSYLK